jgi:RNA polymerase sigma-70 factor (ECF subfamily)
VEGRLLEESELVERAKRGDVDAYDVLVRRYQELAFRIAYLVTFDAAEAEDAAQDGFFKAYSALDRFRPGAPFRPWLLRIVANEARNRRKSSARRLSLLTRLAEARSSDDANTSPEAAALAGERRAMLLAALRRLRDDDRQAITFRYFLDLSEAEMAASIGCARGTVKSRLSRALGRLRESLLGVAVSGPARAEATDA